MFDQILQMVKDHIGGNPAVASAIPAGQADDIHNEIATHVTNGPEKRSGQPGRRRRPVSVAGKQRDVRKPDS